MSRFIFSLFVGLILTAGAHAVEVTHTKPEDVCDFDCSLEQQTLWRAFEKAGPLHKVALPTVFSGACYHRSPELESSQTHYGVAFLSLYEGDIHFNGEFAFHTSSDPYAIWTPEDAARLLPIKYTETNRIHFESDFAWLDYNPGRQPDWQYYLRQTGATIYLVGYWGNKHTLFCALDAHPLP